MDYNNKSIKDLPYMKAEDLEAYVSANKLSQIEGEYLHIRRRRLSVDMAQGAEGKPRITTVDKSQLHMADCSNSYPFKIVVIGDEANTGKANAVQLFNMPDTGQRMLASEILATRVNTCDIQRKKIDVKLTSDDMDRERLCVEVWLPMCTQEHTPLRNLFYQAADAFVIFFSIKDADSYRSVKNNWLPEVRRFIDSNPLYAGTPIVLVGNYSEVREAHNSIVNLEETYPAHMLIPSEDAVALAQDNGVSKYIEIFSDNVYHIEEVFQQCCQAIRMRDSSHYDSDIQMETQRQMMFLQQNALFREFLTVPVPEAFFDQVARTFEITPMPGVDFLYTMDGSEPNASSPRYTEPIKLKKPFPKEIKVIGVSRCKYSSAIAAFTVPEESAAPTAFFDPVVKAFYLTHMEENTTYFYTTDGSKPDNRSKVYTGDGIIFDENPNCCFEVTPKVPQSITIIAVEDGKLRSSVTTFKPFEVIPAPNVHFNPVDHILRIDTNPNYLYRYTVDGSVPSYDSLPYTTPIMLPHTNIKMIRVGAFPRLAFPSRVVDINVSASKSPVRSKTIKVTKTTVGRNQQHEYEAQQPQQAPIKVQKVTLSPQNSARRSPQTHSMKSQQQQQQRSSPQPVQRQKAINGQKSVERIANQLQPLRIPSPVPLESNQEQKQGLQKQQQQASKPSQTNTQPQPSLSPLRSRGPTEAHGGSNSRPSSPRSPRSPVWQREPQLPVRQQRQIKSALTPEAQELLIRRKVTANYLPSSNSGSVRSSPAGTPSRSSSPLTTSVGYLSTNNLAPHSPGVASPNSALYTSSAISTQHQLLQQMINQPRSGTPTNMQSINSPRRAPFSPMASQPPSHIKALAQSSSMQEPATPTGRNTTNAGPSSQSQQCNVTCKADGSILEIEFERNVFLSNIIIKTPGNGLSPSGYQCYAVDDEAESGVVVLGKGYLNDVEGEQVLGPIMSSAAFERGGPFYRKFIVDFTMNEGQSAFKILDMKLDCSVV